MSKYEDNEVNRAKIHEVADKLVGTAGWTNKVLQEVFGDDEAELEDFDSELLELLDANVMECEGCNWHHDPGDLGDGLCEECREDS